MDKNNRIPAGSGSQFTHWALPEVSDGTVVEAVARRTGGDPAAQPQMVTAGELEALSQEAWQEGHTQGYAAGHAEGSTAGHAEGLAAGRAAAKSELARQLADMKKVMAALLDPIASQQDALEGAMVRLTLDTARAVLDREPAAAAADLLPVVREAIRQLPIGERNFTVFLHPDQHARVRDDAEWPASWRIEADRALACGGCRIESEHGLVDYSVGLRFRQVAARLLAEGDEVPEPGRLLEAEDDR